MSLSRGLPVPWAKEAAEAKKIVTAGTSTRIIFSPPQGLHLHAQTSTITGRGDAMAIASQSLLAAAVRLYVLFHSGFADGRIPSGHFRGLPLPVAYRT
jgi:hypothetical protein